MKSSLPREAVAHPVSQWLQSLEKWEALPAGEQEALLAAVAEAVDLASLGEPAAGYETLLDRLQAAERHWDADPWGQDLVHCYQEALDRYRALY